MMRARGKPVSDLRRGERPRRKAGEALCPLPGSLTGFPRPSPPPSSSGVMPALQGITTAKAVTTQVNPAVNGAFRVPFTSRFTGYRLKGAPDAIN